MAYVSDSGSAQPIPHLRGRGGQNSAASPALSINTTQTSPYINEEVFSARPIGHTPFAVPRHVSLDIDDYFTGPRDLGKHSKWPFFLRMHGSILPKLILPLLFVGGWATCITLIHIYRTSMSTNAILLTITGFVVGLSLSFRSATAYERYNEGRKYWAQLILTTQVLGRIIWIHGKERPGPQGEKDLLAKLSALNLFVAFAVALKHKLRFEPYTNHDDLAHLVSHLDTFAGAATRAQPDRAAPPKKPNFFKHVGDYLGVSFAESNPRKAIKKSTQPLGNLPLEILSYISSYFDDLITNGQLGIPGLQIISFNNINTLNDILVGTERVLTTPLPIAYSIAISQITWVYICLLPFQLVGLLGWITVPATVAAAYIILGILFIGREIENPFGHDVNDLPLETYCAQVAIEMDILASRPKPPAKDWIETIDNRVMWPLSSSGWPEWLDRGESRIRSALRAKTELAFEAQQEKRVESEKLRKPTMDESFTQSV